jgi:uncharacterized protein (TIGR02996 family)
MAVSTPRRRKAGREPALTQEEAFLQAILEHPDDETPRRIFSDWLQEQGDPRGEFILAQCELAAMPRHDPRWPDLADREKELREAHGKTWAGTLADLVTSYEFRRGFVERVTLPAATFLQKGRRLFEKAPLRDVRLLPALSGPRLDEVAACPHLDRLAALDLQGWRLFDDGCEVFVNQLIQLDGLTSLNLRATGIGVRGLTLILESPRLPHVHTFDLSENKTYFVYRGAQFLGSPSLAKVRALHLGLTGVADEGAAVLAANAHLGNLHTLALWNTTLGDRGVEALAESPYLTNLTHLDLTGNYIRQRGAEALARSPNMARLTHLELTNNAIGDAGVMTLVKSKYLKKLTYLGTGQTSSISEKGRQALRERFGTTCTLKFS